MLETSGLPTRRMETMEIDAHTPFSHSPHCAVYRDDHSQCFT